mgnify:CR=1 FL=1
MKFKVGDKVCVRGAAWFSKRAIDNEIKGTEATFVDSMIPTLGKTAVIIDIDEDNCLNLKFDDPKLKDFDEYCYEPGWVRKYYEETSKPSKNGKNTFDEKNFILELNLSETKMVIGVLAIVKNFPSHSLTEEFSSFQKKMDDIYEALKAGGAYE